MAIHADESGMTASGIVATVHVFEDGSVKFLVTNHGWQPAASVDVAQSSVDEALALGGFELVDSASHPSESQD